MAVPSGFLILLLSEMGQQIIDVDDRIGFVLADDYIHRFAVLFDDHAVQCQRDRDPLVLADTTVVTRLEESEAAVLIERGLLDVHAGLSM